MVQEANAIGTAWLRLDLVPESAQPKLRETFRSYVDARIATYRKLPDMKAAQKAIALKDRYTFKTEMDEEAKRAMFPSNYRAQAAG